MSVVVPVVVPDSIFLLLGQLSMPNLFCPQNACPTADLGTQPQVCAGFPSPSIDPTLDNTHRDPAYLTFSHARASSQGSLTLHCARLSARELYLDFTLSRLRRPRSARSLDLFVQAPNRTTACGKPLSRYCDAESPIASTRLFGGSLVGRGSCLSLGSSLGTKRVWGKAAASDVYLASSA